MSWIDKLNNVVVAVRCGDGRRYEPEWKNAKRSVNYNHSAYNFINRPGTLIDRREPEGYQYDLELYFQGDSHLDTARNFEISANDKRFWTITHPFYGEIKVQPLSLQRDDTLYNRTLFRIRVWETITSNYPVERLVADDQVEQAREETNEQALINYSSQVPDIDSATRVTAGESLTVIDNVISAELTDDTLFAQFKTIISEARRKINDSTNEPIDTMRSFIRAINFPIQAIESVKSRFAISKELQTQLANIILFPDDGSQSTSRDALLFELLVSTVVAAVSNSAITPGPSDYTIRTEVVEASEELREQYSDFLFAMDSVQAERSDLADSFTPDDLTGRLLDDAVFITLSNLFDQAFDAKQERIIILEYDSNPIVLSHRFYGLDEEDENLQFFIDSNNLSLSELIEVKKGRTIRYYH